MRRILRELRRAIRRRSDNDPRLPLLAKMPKGAVCAEVGVWKGDFSLLIRHITKPARLHLIDPWEFQPEFPDRIYGGSIAKGQMDMDRIHEYVKSRFRKYPELVVNRGKSAEILREFEDSYFDWVYIDGNHSYETVREDLEISLAKVRPGGIIAGDDYWWDEANRFPVKRAVEDFMQSNNRPGTLEILDQQFMITLREQR